MTGLDRRPVPSHCMMAERSYVKPSGTREGGGGGGGGRKVTYKWGSCSHCQRLFMDTSQQVTDVR